MDIKNNQIKSMNERIKGLMNKNKELNNQLEQEPLEQQEQKIKQEKLDNNNELRKQRTQKYELEQIKEDADYMKRIYLHLRKMGIVKSQYEYSTQFLNRTHHYFSMILSEQRHPSIDSINELVKNLTEIRNLYEEDYNKNTHVRLLEQFISDGKHIITKRLLKYL